MLQGVAQTSCLGYRKERSGTTGQEEAGQGGASGKRRERMLAGLYPTLR